MANDFLLEIGTEEMPAAYMPALRQNLEGNAYKVLKEKRIDFEKCSVFSTPRRLSLLVQEMAELQNDKEESVRGPGTDIAFDENNNPTKAAEGFARSQGLEVDDLISRDGYLYSEKVIKGKKSIEILKDIIPEMINSLNLPRTMRWGSSKYKFIRPIRWFLSLFGDNVVKFELAEIKSGRITYGHRFLSKEKIKIDCAEDYFKTLEKNHVIVDHVKRKSKIIEQFNLLKLKEGRVLIEDELLEEVVELIEYPTAFYGEYENEFLDIPAEVLITSMSEHQRYFPVINEDEKLLPYFVGVRNGNDKHIDKVIHGNEMVLKARLADARFFYEEDLKSNSQLRKEKLKEIVYQKELGSMYDKVQRVCKLSVQIARGLGLDEKKINEIENAANLSKNDLVTEMVGEFASLQGVMGREYALINGEKKEVADAIFEQYLPKYAADKLPESMHGIVLSIADKIDNICALFSQDLIPSGSQDPFALRRQAAGIIKILAAKNLELKLSELINWELKILRLENNKKLYKKIKDFLVKRVNNILEEKNIRYDIINAVLSVDDDNPVDILNRADAVMELREDNPEVFLDLIRGLVRASNLADKYQGDDKFSEELLEEKFAENLYKNYQKIIPVLQERIKSCRYKSALKELVRIKEPVDEFLDNVVVMVEDIRVRNNRLLLLSQVSSLIEPVMDINKITLD